MTFQELKYRAYYYRDQLNSQNISDYRVKSLIDLGFIFSVPDFLWNKQYKHLCEFVSTHGSFPPKATALGRWCCEQRYANKKNTLSPNRIEKLNHIGFIWDLKEQVWNMMYEQLVSFYKKHGHLYVKYTEGKLGAWCNFQRQCYEKQKLSRERIDKLNSIGFTWNYLQFRWNKHYHALVEFHKKSGHCNISQRDGALGMWCHNQRTKHKQGKLSKERIKLLNKIGFQWSFR